jgi:hypothetical protein
MDPIGREQSGAMAKFPNLGARELPYLVGWYHISTKAQTKKENNVGFGKKTVFRRNPILVDGLDFFIFHILGIILPTDELHHFSEGRYGT